MRSLSRREFAAIVATGAGAARSAGVLASGRVQAGAPVTAADLVERIRQHIGVDWQADTVDTVKAGNQSTRVTGVVTTALASMAVLQQAVAAGANVVITYEPTFYSRADSTAPPAGRGGGRRGGANQPPPVRLSDPIFTAKNDFIVGRVVSEEPGMAVCAAWLRGLVPEVSVRHISAGDPYWRPA